MGSRSPAPRNGLQAALPAHFDREVRCLEAVGVTSWEALAALDPAGLRRLAADGRSSEARLLRLRAQGRLLLELELAPEQAALLLHAGIADGRALAEADPQRLWVQVGRLQRRLTGPAVPPLPLATLREWIARARRCSGRSGN